MLIPVYIVGFILAGLILFAIAGRISNLKAKIFLHTIAVVAGPLFFLVVVIFSGWVREKSYETEWLTGESAAKYAIFRQSISPQEIKDVVVLRRYVNNQKECYNVFVSRRLATYLEALPKHTVTVRYKVIYDFFQRRTYFIESIGDIPYAPDVTSWKTVAINEGSACFPWFD
jgi:hypothetical protein